MFIYVSALCTKLGMIMADVDGGIKIYGKGHPLCLQRTLQSSLAAERFSDVTLVAFPESSKSLRANRSVLAACSPIFNHLLKDVTDSDEAVLIFSGYSTRHLASMLQYVYTGQVTVYGREEEVSLSSLFQEMQIGGWCDSDKSQSISFSKRMVQPHHPEPDKKVESTIQLLHRQLEPALRGKKKQENVTCNKNPDAKSKANVKGRMITLKPSTLPKDDKMQVTLPDPVVLSQRSEFMRNPYAPICVPILEKICIKFSMLPKEVLSTASILDWPRLNNRVGIYGDPQLLNYYHSLMKSLPPIRIYLHIEEEEVDDEQDAGPEESAKWRVRKESCFSSYGRVKKVAKTRKTFASSRLAVKTMCFVNGKTHLTLGTTAMEDSNGSVQQVGGLNCQAADRDTEEDKDGDSDDDNRRVEELMQQETLRRRQLIGTLSRLKKDCENARNVARQILTIDDSERIDTTNKTSQQERPFKTSTSKRSGREFNFFLHSIFLIIHTGWRSGTIFFVDLPDAFFFLVQNPFSTSLIITNEKGF